MRWSRTSPRLRPATARSSSSQVRQESERPPLAKAVLERADVTVLEGFGAREGTSAYGPLVSVLRALLRSQLVATPIEPPFGPHLALLLPELGTPAPASDRATLFEAIRSVLALAASKHPLALFLDDLQWSDDATLDLLPALARSLESEPVLILAAYRSDEVPRGHPIRRLRSELRRARRLRELVIEPFDPPTTAFLLERVLGGAVAPSLRDAVVDRTNGVPFFVEELGLALAASERLRPGRGGLELVEGADLPLPDSVRDAVLLGAAGLSKEVRAGAMVAAVAGQTVDASLVTEIAGPGDWLQELLRRGILVEGPGDTLTFRHALVREALYAEIPWLQRRALHREVAERLEADGAPAYVVAEHWSKGREPDRARHAFLSAADAFCGVHAYRDGARSALRALELWPDGQDERGRLEALERLAACAERAGDLGDAVRTRREIVEGRRAEGDARRIGEASRRLAAVLELQGRWEEALSSREAAAAAFASASEPGEAAAERLAAATHLRSAASFGASLQLLAIARQEARGARRVDLEARILALEGNVRSRMGEGPEGSERVRAALTMALDHNLTAAAAEIYQRLADSFEHEGDYPAARATYDDAVAFCTASGQEPTAQVCLACLTAVLRQTGDWERAVVLCRQVLASADAVLHARTVAIGHARLDPRPARRSAPGAAAPARVALARAADRAHGGGAPGGLGTRSRRLVAGSPRGGSGALRGVSGAMETERRPALRDLAAPLGDHVLRRVRERAPAPSVRCGAGPDCRRHGSGRGSVRRSRTRSARPRSWTGIRSRPQSSSAARSICSTASARRSSGSSRSAARPRR